MANDKNFVQEITNMEEDFAQWYTDIVKKAELIDYTSVKGCMAIRPAGYAIWEHMQANMDKLFKETGVQNCYMPLFIPESLLEKESRHVEGFAPEVAWVTHGGAERLQERLCVRPTSETLFCDYYNKIVQSHRDLPQLLNQWCSVVRWEKTTRPFLRSREFLWQEGHTAHATAEGSHERTILMLDVYARFFEEYMAIPVIKGVKTEKERFAGAKETYTIEALMHDGKALQSGTSHDFGDGFARAFDIKYTDKDNTLKYVHQTSWGTTTRMIGALIMVHGDNSGLKLPPRLAPTQLMIVPIAMHKDGVMDKANEVLAKLSEAGIRVRLDDSDKSPGFKFSESEMRGVPLRLELGPKDVENNSCILVRRDTAEKQEVALDNVEGVVAQLLEDIQENMYNTALKHRDEHTYVAKGMDEFADTIKNKPGFIKSMWCGSRECEDRIKEYNGASARCIPFKQEKVADTCVCCGKPAKHMVYWAVAY